MLMVIWLRNGVEKSWNSISVCLLCISQKRVLSGFVVLLVLLTVFLFNVSFKTPFLDPIFQGFNSFSSNSSYFSNATDAKLTSSLDFMQIGETPQVNVSDIVKNGSVVSDSRSGGDFEDALLRNSSDVSDGRNRGDFEDALLRNSSDLVKDVSDGRNRGDFEDALLRNSSDLVKDISDSTNRGDFEDTLLRNSSDLVKDVSEGRNRGDFEDALLRNSSDLVKDERFVADRNVTAEKSIEGKLGEEKGIASLVGESVGSRDESGSGNRTSFIGGGDKLSNISDNRENGESLPSPEVKIPVVPLEKINATIFTKQSQIAEMQKTSLGKCDIFDGRWVRDDTKPYYPAGSCPHIDTVFDCYLNKRPDSEFVKWRWQPNGCDIPSLNATDFLERLRGKKLVFVGDSLNRNMWESLVCILRHSVKDKKRIHEKRVSEIPEEKGFKNQGYHAFIFEDYDCTVDFVTSRFLVRESSSKGKNDSLETLRLDLMDQSTSMYSNANYLIFNTGHWWSHDKTSKRQNYYQEGNIVHTSLKVHDAYRKALRTWARWVDKNIDRKKTHVIFRGYSATHFRGGNWNTGGQCHQETEPSIHNIHLLKYRSKMRALERVIQDMKTPVIYLNITRLTDYRKDAHPSIYRTEQTVVHSAVHPEDCSHWCLPGVPDTWNELLYASLLKIGTGSWKA